MNSGGDLDIVLIENAFNQAMKWKPMSGNPVEHAM